MVCLVPSLPTLYTHQGLTVLQHSNQIVNKTIIYISNNNYHMHKSCINSYVINKHLQEERFVTKLLVRKP